MPITDMKKLGRISISQIRGSRGAVLFVGLMMLLLMTLLGITAMQITILQERMSGNFRVEHQAFEVTEGKLATGQADIRNVTTALDKYSTRADLTAANTTVWDSWLSGVQSTAQDSIQRRYCGPGCSDSRGVPTSTDPERLVNFYILSSINFDSSKTSTAIVQSVYVF